MTFFRQLFIGKGGNADEMAVLAVLGVLTFLGLAVYAVVGKGQAFDPQAFGIGLGSAIGAAAIGMGLKSKAESAQADKPEEH